MQHSKVTTAIPKHQMWQFLVFLFIHEATSLTLLQAANSVRRIAEVNETISESKVTQHVKLEQQQTSASRD